MRIFGSDRLDGMLQKLGLKDGEAIVHPWINKALLKAQQKVEARNFDLRKNILKYDDVMNEQRKVIFEQRIGLMRGQDVSETIDDMRREVVEDAVARHIPESAYAEQWDAKGLKEELLEGVGIEFPVEDWVKEEGIADEEIRERIQTAADGIYNAKREKYGKEVMMQVEKAILLQTLDRLWRDHIITVDHLRGVIHLRGYGQRDPLNEYKSEAFNLFAELLTQLKQKVTGQIMRVEIQSRLSNDDLLPDEDELPMMQAHHIDATTGEDDVGEGLLTLAKPQPQRTAAIDPKNPSTWGKVGRNEPCPCGSGKRYKHCHGAFV
ncbi:MAG: SEC-C domain-containing protein, partial [Proteobacteria bacterium]|nr:SEC-C domain-containing protein [Pseudomonadota bacterium]